MQTVFTDALLSDGSDQRHLWYLPDRRIQTRAAAEHAARIAELVVRGHDREQTPDDHALFTAMHTCAYRARQCRAGTSADATERETWRKRWHDIREYAVRKHIGLVYMVLGRFNSEDWDEDDRVSEAMYVLGRAVARYSPWKGFRFSTYACNAIVRALMRRLRREKRYRRLFPMQLDGLPERPSKERTFGKELYAERLRLAFTDNRAGLTDLEASIIRKRFPLEARRRLTLQKISQDVGLCKERVRQLQNTALKKLHAALESDPVLR